MSEDWGCFVLFLCVLMFVFGFFTGAYSSSTTAYCHEQLTYHATTELDSLRVARQYDCDLPTVTTP